MIEQEIQTKQKPEKSNCAEITDALKRHISTRCFYKVPNIYFFDWESDYLVIKSSGYAYEYEIKVTRSDFFNDFKKEKHKKIIEARSKTESGYTILPNKFYFVCQEGLISKDEVPEYAGLMYYKNNRIYIIKEAKYIHFENQTKIAERLCHKFYERMVAFMNDASDLKSRMRDVRNENMLLIKRIQNQINETTNGTDKTIGQ